MKDIEVTVQSILPSEEPQGRFRLRVSTESTVEDLLKQLCQEAGTNPRADYCLRSKGRDILKRTDTLAQSGVQDGAFLHWTNESVDTKIPCRFNILWILAIASFIIGVAGIVAICVVRSKYVDPNDFAIVFDAGSTHTAMYIYKWEGSKLNGTAVASQFGSKCTAPGNGISDFVNNPHDAGQSIQACIDTAKAAIPTDKYSNTPIYLGATAGMRLLKIANATACEAILNSIRATLSQSPFKFTDHMRYARIISGSEEGAFSWITSNFVTNAFKALRSKNSNMVAYTIVSSIGALDLGGASTQITFDPSNSSKVPANDTFVTQLFGKNYSLYTHSYLCYGAKEVNNRIFVALVKEQVNETLIKHPCLPTGYSTTLTYAEMFDSQCISGNVNSFEFTPSGLPETAAENYTFVGLSNQTECVDLLNRTLFNRSSCPYDRCSFNGVYQPQVSGIFYAFASYFYVTDFLNLSSSNTSYFNHSDFRVIVDKICSYNWTQLLPFATSKSEKANLMYYCQQANYIDMLLDDIYGFNATLWLGINFVGKISSTDIGWTLGFVLNESNNYPAYYPENAMYTLTFGLLMALFCLFIVSRKANFPRPHWICRPSPHPSTTRNYRILDWKDCLK